MLDRGQCYGSEFGGTVTGNKMRVKPSSSNRRGYSAQLTRLIPDVAKKAWRSRGFINHEILSRWGDITGPETAQQSVPIKMVFPRGERMHAVLHLKVTPAHALMVQHNEPRIIERINGFFGYSAVSRIRIHQGPVPNRTTPKAAPTPEPDPKALAKSDRLTKPVKDDKLRALLQRWGADIMHKYRS